MLLSGLKESKGKSSLVGNVEPFAGNSIPEGWLECTGQAVSRTTYSRLFARIGTTYGVGNGSTTFNVPDLRGEFVRGLDLGRGLDPGRTLSNSPQGHRMATHNHFNLPGTNPARLIAATVNAPHNHTSPVTAASPALAHSHTRTGSSTASTLQPITLPLLNNQSYSSGPAAAASSSRDTSATNIGHAHTGLSSGASPGFGAHVHPVGGSTGPAGGTTNNSENRPRNIALKFIIKY